MIFNIRVEKTLFWKYVSIYRDGCGSSKLITRNDFTRRIDGIISAEIEIGFLLYLLPNLNLFHEDIVHKIEKIKDIKEIEYTLIHFRIDNVTRYSKETEIPCLISTTKLDVEINSFSIHIKNMYPKTLHIDLDENLKMYKGSPLDLIEKSIRLSKIESAFSPFYYKSYFSWDEILEETSPYSMIFCAIKSKGEDYGNRYSIKEYLNFIKEYSIDISYLLIEAKQFEKLLDEIDTDLTINNVIDNFVIIQRHPEKVSEKFGSEYIDKFTFVTGDIAIRSALLNRLNFIQTSKYKAELVDKHK